MAKKIPFHLTHKPIVWVNYDERDLKANPDAGDAEFLSIGRATWFEDDCSVKVWRRSERGKWSRQAEDVPIYRLLDMCILFLSEYYDIDTNLGLRKKTKDVSFVEGYLTTHKHLYDARIDEIHRLISLAKQK